MKNYLAVSLIILLLAGCASKQPVTETPLSVVWEMGENEVKPGFYENTFHLTNTGKNKLDKNWILYFCQLPAIPENNPEAPFVVEEISSTYFRLYPSENYTPIASGETQTFTFRCQGNIIKETNAPRGAYIVLLDEEGKEASKPMDVEIKVTPFLHEYQWARKGVNEIPYPYGDIVYEANMRFQEPVELKPTDIFPSIKSIKSTNGELPFTKDISIIYDSQFKNEAEYLSGKLQAMFGCSVTIAEKQQGEAKHKEGATPITLSDISAPHKNEVEGKYSMTVSPQGLTIASGNKPGAFYGAQTLLSIIGNYKDLPATLGAMEIEDYPDLQYRGQMLDVCRNFIKKENILKMIDIFASYKLNVLHLHLGDDEGWRLEIPGLEELTTTGAHRGHTLDELGWTYPQYNGGWDASDKDNLGNGFYTRDEFIEILRYATDRHISVIPEFDTPGHSRAAIKAMNARYHKYKDTDKAKAEEFLLVDFEDTSDYYSAQAYTDNVINVAMPSVYNFLYKVIDEVIDIYKEAGAELSIFHLGGDEVANGVWEGSPICHKFMQEKGMTEFRELKDYFIEQMLDYLKDKNLELAGWQEITLLPGGIVNPKFKGSKTLSYCWSTIPEWGEDEIPYSLANSGNNIILCNVTNLYFDLAYNKHQHEPGLYWGGFVDEYKSFDVLPYEIYKSLRQNMRGEPVDIEARSKTKLALNKNAYQYVRGMQGQLWAEAMRGQKMVERCLFPKIFGLSDRAWNAQPAWSKTQDDKVYKKALEHYNAKITMHEFPRLLNIDINFHISQPGLLMKDGMLYANSTIPQAAIYYTTDGSEPTTESPLWKSPVACDAKEIKAKIFHHGRESVTTLLRLN